MTRRQVRRMVRHEGILTALLGASLGMALGIGLAGAVIGSLDHDGLRFRLPTRRAPALIAGTVAVDLAASILPVRRSSRLDLMDALHHQ